AMAVITIAKRCFFINNLLNTQVENKLITNFSTERSSQSSLAGTGRKNVKSCSVQKYYIQ
ncbi:hypothetical protein, partial [Escherichia coli]|uniref:hypothetical protein n=1 Tax=Escherichia coli TaxID=562 RepID=UPI001A916C10